jgi:hypothetical protein
LGLSLFGCSEPQIYYSEEVSKGDSQTASLVGRPRVCLRIGEGFSAAEQDLILAAVARENLRATVQFDFASETSDAPRPGSWTLLKADQPAAVGAEAVHVTERFARGGGAIDLYVERMQAGDLQKAIAAGLAAGSDLRCPSLDSPPHTAAVPHLGPM